MIEPIKEKELYLFPFIKITKFKNPLTKEAKKDFGVNWGDYLEIEFGWLHIVYIYSTFKN